MRYPADSEAWITFDEEHRWFAEDARNVRLGLASDGFNPFNNMAKPYSIWPVILVPYNFPLWLCMKEAFFMTSLIIPGPKSPRNEIEVYMQPLVDELSNLWENGVATYDPFSEETFMLHAALLWTINDFPAYEIIHIWGIVDSYHWITHGGKKKSIFNGKEDHCTPPTLLTGPELLGQLTCIGHVSFGKCSKKRKHTPEELNWTKKSIFFNLPYWSTLKFQHNLDVMHIEKSICNSILGMLMNIPGKSKDNINARRDLSNLGIRKELHLIHDGDRCTMPPATFALHGDERKSFCEWLSAVKFPDGFAANISHCVSMWDCKISSFKNHDCHVFMQRLLPAAVGGYLRKDISLTLIEFSNFFRELCAQTLDRNLLKQPDSDIVNILYKLEMIFPPSFFDVMVHLAVHLPREALLGDSIQYRWMYPFERYLSKFKRYVKNKAHPEGSIAEAYIHVEYLIFCSMYLYDIETRFNREDRNIDGLPDDEGRDEFSVFTQKFCPLGISTQLQLDDKLFKSARWYVLNNCTEIATYLEYGLILYVVRLLIMFPMNSLLLVGNSFY
ncbi:uncharacterized protein LOC121245474 [Juglans microcarpa x Juglans regia]|uniref:uncharacterized protein LOC121245474 n=1 Tax=Juglans microcarpa x Juglans regia TaxID=2249226 RepID=UPI001B7E6555|nr:uncharacterized protein LOC121245474 [Juglans microcarpa x Juglans regia]